MEEHPDGQGRNLVSDSTVIQHFLILTIIVLFIHLFYCIDCIYFFVLQNKGEGKRFSGSCFLHVRLCGIQTTEETLWFYGIVR
jgi:hypothetical protein